MAYKTIQKRKEYANRYYLEHREEILKKHKENVKRLGPRKSKLKYNLSYSGWTPEMKNTSLIEQGNKCAICREIFTATPHCDHRHTNPPEPRALLCGNCNRALGLFKENPERCEAAAEYLRNWS